MRHGAFFMIDDWIFGAAVFRGPGPRDPPASSNGLCDGRTMVSGLGLQIDNTGQSSENVAKGPWADPVANHVFKRLHRFTEIAVSL